MDNAVLAGIRVLDMTEALAGPSCAMLLGDLGAEVIKVERPGVGDMTRGWAPPFVGPESAYFMSTNRNKRGITLNLKHPLAQAVFHRLAAQADVFVVNQPTIESLQRLRADPETLAALNPRLIICLVSGYGMTGPYYGQSGYDLVAQAQSGLMALTGEPGQPPVRYPIPLADATAGLYCVIGVLSALLARQATGRGQVVDVSLLDSQVAWLTNMAAVYFATGKRPAKPGNAHPNIVPYQPFKARDKYLIISVGSDRLWQRFCAALDAQDTLGCDPRFTTNPDRLRNRGELIPLLDEIFGQRDAEFWLERLRAADIPCGPINEMDEALADPHVLARGMVIELQHPTAGTVHALGNPVHLSETPVGYRLPAPTLGQHTVEVLGELGYSTEEIEELMQAGAI